jgi:hypothetical protein
MELLKDKIDKTSDCTKLFSNTKWVISFDDICKTPNSSSGDDNPDIEYFDYNNINLKDVITTHIDVIEDNDNSKDNVHIIDAIIPNNNIKTDDVLPVEIVEPTNSIKSIQPTNPIKPVESPVQPIKPVESTTPTIKINKIENNKLSPLEFFKQSLDLYEDDDIIKSKLFTFISTQKISIKYTKKGVSMIMDGITQNKWNIYICKLFSFLLDISFEYRKQQICDTLNSKFIIKK